MSDDRDPDVDSVVGPSKKVTSAVPPRVPFLTPRNPVDLGPAGTLVQARDRERASRLAARPPRRRDWRLWCSAGLAAVALVLFAVALDAMASTSLWGALLAFLAIGIASVSMLLLSLRLQLGHIEADLNQQIAHERAAARELDILTSLGWSVLHDRVVPGTEHRLAHVLAGPAGVVVATVLPMTGPLRYVDGVLHSGEVALDGWFETRWWEVNRVNDAVAAELADWPFLGPTYPVVLIPRVDAPGRVQRWLRQPAPTMPHPTVYASAAVCTTAEVRRWIAAKPAPLGRLAAAQLAGATERTCLPAGARD